VNAVFKVTFYWKIPFASPILIRDRKLAAEGGATTALASMGLAVRKLRRVFPLSISPFPGCQGSLSQITQKLRPRPDAANQQMFPRPRAGDIKEMPLGVVDLLQIRFILDALDAFL